MPQDGSDFANLLATAGEMATRVRGHDWSKTPLGPPAQWPQSLRTAVGICLNSRFPMFIWWGRDLINIYNDAYAPVLGKRHPDALGRRASDVWHDIWDVVGPQAEAVMSRGESTWNERVPLLMERNGYAEQTYFTWSYSPIPDGDNGIGGLFCACTEETLRVRAEAAAHEADQRYRAVFEAARDAMIVYSSDGRIVEVNPAACRTYGFSYDEFIGIDAREKMHPDAVPLFDEFMRVAASGAEFRCETTDRHRDGRAFAIEVIGTALTYNGRPHMMSVIRDITERRRATERISRLHAVAAALSEAVTPAEVARVSVEQGIAALGATAGSLSLLSADGTMLEMAGSVGYPPEAMRPWQRFPLDAPIPLSEAVLSGEAIYLTSPEERLARYPALANVRASKETRASACIPLRVGGAVLGVIGLSFDEPNEFTAEDRAFAVSLSRQCVQALERARLFDAERAARAVAEHASRMKDEFLATLSHELRTPLSAIVGWSQIIRRGSAGQGDIRQGLEIIERNARAQAQIIEDLLDMSRIVSGKLRLEPQRLELATVVRAALQTVQHAADAKGVPLAVSLDGASAVVSGDPSRLQQVFWNLLSNAIKFTPRGGHVRVALSKASGGGGDGSVCVVVSDDGEGIRPDFLPHVFDRFRQADPSTTRSNGGLGLGLSIVRQLVELHGGSVRAASDGTGKGSTFTVTLPLAPAQHEHVPRIDVAERDDAAGAAKPLAGVRVVIVDDEPDARLLAQRVLDDAGAITRVAATAAEALVLVRTGATDVLVSDIGMPGEDGYTLIRNVHALPGADGVRSQPLPAIALTAYAQADDRAKSLAAGYRRHLVKPIDPAELVAVVAAVAGTAATGRG